MKTIEEKALRLVVTGRVHVEGFICDEDGSVAYAGGTVESSRTYHVEFTPAGVTCDCPWGMNRNTTHSHDLALRLEATRLIERAADSQETR